MDNTKRVYCLYRVSTVGQVEKNDIPMQKQYCREFAEAQKNWHIEKELYEKGVSGFKKSAKERDAIQEIQGAAVDGLFDILLVFMFDRLGRRDDETPFIVEWFVKNGIEVWSAMEGQQRFDTHVDKLMNYIRYWQASGESIKTSMRVKTRLEQLTESGCFTGGTVPYGYRLENCGRMNKRNREVRDLVIDEDAAAIIRLIFHKYVYEGYGAQRLCKYLAEKNICKEDGRNFPNTTINRIIKNELYTGVIHNGEAKSSLIPELQIIDRETYEQAKRIMQGRTMLTAIYL
jgi:DNA invertase Pin-like site-specific DNA recombinase